MKKILVITSILLTYSMSGQQITPKDAFLEKWDNSKAYLLAVAEAMPDSLYNYKPTDRQMSFKEQLMHIKGNMDWLSTTYFTELEFEKKKTPPPNTKKETIALIQAAFTATSKRIKNSAESSLQEEVSFFAGPKSKLQILNLLQDHVTHHRGQLIVYLNLNEIEPPRYVGW